MFRCSYILSVVTAELQTANVAFFSKKNPIVRILSISGWLGVPVNPDKFSSTVLRILNNKCTTFFDFADVTE